MCRKHTHKDTFICVCVCVGLHCQALLLHGSLPEEDQDGSVSLGDTRPSAEQQLVWRLLSCCLQMSPLTLPSSFFHLVLPLLKVLIRSRLDQSTEETLNLKVL